MIRITRSLILRKDIHFFQNAPLFMAKQITFEIPKGYCQNSASVNTQLQENCPVNNENCNGRRKTHEIIQNAFSNISYESLAEEDLIENTKRTFTGMEQRMNVHPVQKALQNLVVEGEAIDFCRNFTPPQTIMLMKHLALTNNRAHRLLKNLCDKIVENNWKLSLIDASSVFYYLAVLGCKHKEILDHLAGQILDKKQHITGHVLPASTLQSVGVLRYRNCEFIEELLKLMIKFPTTISGMVKSVTTLASVNFQTPYGKILLKELSEQSPSDFPESLSYLNFVWSSVILNEVYYDHISNILTESFANKILTTHERNNEQLFLKMWNLQGAVQALRPDYDGSLLDDSFIQKYMKKPQYTKFKAQFLTSVVDGFGQIFPKVGYLKTMADLPGGFVLDVECCFDRQERPVLLKKYDKNCIKIGVVLLTYHECCIAKDLQLTGPCALKIRVAEANGYKIFTVPLLEYKNSLKLSEKVEYLQSKVHECIVEK